MKITLICPAWKNKGLTSISFFNSIPPLGLLQLAALTPLEYELEIINENDTPIDFDRATDLVGLTAMTALTPRAYEIAAEYKKRNVPVVMGGIHASVLPEEAGRYVDCVVIGEADLIWSKILADAKNNQLQPVYHAPLPADLDLPDCRPVRKTYPAKFLKHNPFGKKLLFLQSQRGCPHNCEFCSVTKFNGRVIRHKSISALLEEIEREKTNGFKRIVFADDNLTADKAYAKELFKELRRAHVRWISQADIRIADDDVLDLACQSGLAGVFLGLETLNAELLAASVGKTKSHWRPIYEKAIQALHQRGVMVEGSFIFGFDHEPKETVERTVDWAIHNRLDLAQFSILTPLPGTALYEKLSLEGRILTHDWARYNTLECVFRPAGQSKEELENKLKGAYKQFYSFGSIIKRINKLPALDLAATLLTNFEFRRFRP